MRRTFLLIALALGVSWASAQQDRQLVQDYLEEHRGQWGLTEADISAWTVTDNVLSKHNQVRHYYIQQTHKDIPVFNAVANANIWQGRVLNMGNSFVSKLENKVNATTPSLTPVQAVEAAAMHLGLNSGSLRILSAETSTSYFISKGDVSLEDIPVRLMYQPLPEGEVNLAWDLSILVPKGDHWWSMRVDAISGQVLHKVDWVSQCDFGGDHRLHDHSAAPAPSAPSVPAAAPPAPDDYRIYPMPVESPNHGNRVLVTNPADPTASPFGWHDDNGQAGPEHTITRGNNVHAYEDRAANNAPGYSPDGGANLIFDFPLNFNQAPSGYEDAAITNLFYWNNVMHDVWYQYGFDEASGNFQENNYGNGGSGGDYVRAEAQDGGGTNNANFATPPEGQNPRMQMFLWTNGSNTSNYLTVNTPGGIAGAYAATSATFGPGVPQSPLTADVVLVDDNAGVDPNDGCDPIVNGSALTGKIALIRRANCTFVAKVEAAQNEGAVAVIIMNNVGGGPVAMGGQSGNITIPSIMISQADGNAILAAIQNGDSVNATISDQSGNFDTDGDFDNGVIAHEYGHGISTRLTGGASNSGCLSGDEQMGEGWSDWFGLMLTIEPGDQATDVRGIGTFATGQSTTGQGIRNAPYSTDFAVNNFTYAATNNTAQVSQPHGVGFVWCTMLWDLNWALIDQYGLDPDVYNGSGGNNMAMQLVIDALKLQPCNPGFVDGRDAILQADQINYNGANQCLIWEVFANRGLGFSADQGSSNSRTDQTEAFDIPTSCQTPVLAPTAAFTSDNGSPCGGDVFFTDNSTNVPQQWLWLFGDGNTSTQQNPTHTYAASGTYTVTLIVSNTLGADSSVQQVTVTLPDPPTVTDGEACVNDQVTLSGTVNGSGYIQWQDGQGNIVGTGPTYTTPPLTATTSYQAFNIISFPPQNVGPANAGIGGGGYHGTTFTGTVNFTAQDAFSIVSAWVDCDGAGNRDLFLWNGSDGTGSVVQQVSVNLPNGQSRAMLNFQVPGPGDYSIGGTGVDMYRNNSGASYPYTIPGLVTLTGSSAGPDFYYYLYDLEILRDSCISDPSTAVATVVDADFSFSAAGNGNVTFTDNSTGATSWAWDFGDGNSSTSQNPTNAYQQSGVYVVTLEINGGTCTVRDTLELTVVGVEEALEDPASVNLLPNPTTGSATLFLSTATKKAITVEVVSLDGRVLKRMEMGKGRAELALDIADLPNAMYFVTLSAGDQRVVKKLLLQQ